MKVTIFTPAYNRASYLPTLYQALKEQSDKNFEWLIVDDGSVDNTQEVVEAMIAQSNDFEIRYHHKANEGLNQTINKGLDLAQYEAFCRVDSDDSICDNGVESIRNNWHLIADNDKLCALVFLTVHFDNPTKVVGYHPFAEKKVSNFWDYRVRYHGRGDRLEVVKTEIFRNFKFERFGDEKFCLEGLVWNRMADKYDALYLPIAIYKRLYDTTGITHSQTIFLKNNPCGSTAFYADVCRRNPSIKYFIKAAASYFRYGFSTNYGFNKLVRDVSFKTTLIGLPVGVMLLIVDKIYPGWQRFFTKV